MSRPGVHNGCRHFEVGFDRRTTGVKLMVCRSRRNPAMAKRSIGRIRWRRGVSCCPGQNESRVRRRERADREIVEVNFNGPGRAQQPLKLLKDGFRNLRSDVA